MHCLLFGRYELHQVYIADIDSDRTQCSKAKDDGNHHINTVREEHDCIEEKVDAHSNCEDPLATELVCRSR